MRSGVIVWWDVVKVLFLLGGLVLLARFVPSLVGSRVLPGRRRHLRLLDSLHLGTDRSVHVVQVDGIRLVLGVSRTGITVLREMDGVCEEQTQISGVTGEDE
jgi:flagellar biogenesis protein FliO